MADISNFANHFTNEMVCSIGQTAEGESAESCDVFSDFGYVAPVSTTLRFPPPHMTCMYPPPHMAYDISITLSYIQSIRVSSSPYDI